MRLPLVQDGDARTPAREHPPHAAPRGNPGRAAAPSGWHQHWLGGEGISKGAERRAGDILLFQNVEYPLLASIHAQRRRRRRGTPSSNNGAASSDGSGTAVICVIVN